VLAASAALQRSRADAERAERGLDELERRLEGERNALRESEAEAQRADVEAAKISHEVAPELRLRAEEGSLDSVETTEGDLRRAREALEALGERPGSSRPQHPGLPSSGWPRPISPPPPEGSRSGSGPRALWIASSGPA